MKKTIICPRCGKVFEGYPAISRLDNKTEICSKCGVQEALIDYGISLLKKKNKSNKVKGSIS